MIYNNCGEEGCSTEEENKVADEVTKEEKGKVDESECGPCGTCEGCE